MRRMQPPGWSALTQSASTETGSGAVCRFNAVKPKVSAHMERVADDSTLQFWGIALRELGNVPKPPLEHPR